MDTKEQVKTQCEHTKEQLLKKIDRILDDAEDSGHLSDQDAHVLKDCWKAIWYSCQCCCISN